MALTDEHRAALSQARTESAAIRRYLEALGTKPRGRPITADSLQRRIHALQEQIADETNPLRRVELYQRTLYAEETLAALADRPDRVALEAGFVEHAKPYSERNGISHAAWREVGVPAAVLKKAGIHRGN